MTFYNQLSQAFSYSGTLFNRPPGGTLLLRRLHLLDIGVFLRILVGFLVKFAVKFFGTSFVPVLACFCFTIFIFGNASIAFAFCPRRVCV